MTETREKSMPKVFVTGVFGCLVMGFLIGLIFPPKGIEMNNENAKAVSCPSCQGPAIKVGNEITCEKCDATFAVIKKEGAKVKQIGPIADHEQRIQALEQKSVPKEGPSKAEQEPEAETDEEL